MSECLLFDEGIYEKLPEVNKPVFVFDWLRTLEMKLPDETKKTIRECQEDLVQQLLAQLSRSTSRVTHILIGKCLANVFIVGDTVLVYTAVNTCNSLLKSRDDGTSTTAGRQAALTCLGAIYKQLGRMIGRCFEDSVSLIVKVVKQSESHVRYEAVNTLCSLIEGVGSAASKCNKDIYKCAKSCLTDRVLSVRSGAAKCLNSLVDYYPPMYTNDLEAMISLCFRSMDGSNHPVRLEAAKLLGNLLAKSQQQQLPLPPLTVVSSASANGGSNTGNSSSSKMKRPSLKDALSSLASGFFKGPGGFLKGATATDMIKGTNSVNREVRVGVTYAYIEFVTFMGSSWFETNLGSVISHCIRLLANPRSVPTHTEAIFARHCVFYLLNSLCRRLLSDPVQLAAARELVALIRQELRTTRGFDPCEDGTNELSSHQSSTDGDEKVVGSDALDVAEDPSNSGLGESPKGPDFEVSASRRGFGRGSAHSHRQQQQQHVIVCALDQLTELVRCLDSIVAPLLDPPHELLDVLHTTLVHPQAPVRLAAANCLRQLTIALPCQRAVVLDRCISCVQQAQRCHGDAILGHSAVIAGILAGSALDNLGLPSSRARQVFSLAEELLRAANQNSRLTLPRTQAGWMLLGAYMTLGPELVKPHLPRILLFWRNAFPRTIRELEAEKQRGDAFTWQVMLEARSGALCSIQSFLEYCSSMLVSEEAINHLLAPVECALNMLTHLLEIVRIYGNHLKATASVIRHRLYRILLLLPPAVYASSYSILLRELVAEFTLTDNAANTTTSLLRQLCRSEDSVTLNSWIPESDQRVLEEQIQSTSVSAAGALEHDPAFLFLKDGMTPISAPCVSCSMDSVLHECQADISPSRSPSGSCGSANLLTMSTLCLSFQSNAYSSHVHSGTGCASQQLCTPHIGGPPPIIVAVIDSAVELFGRLFPCVPIRHRTQMIDHFAECIHMAKSTRQEAVQINVFAAILSALRRLADTKVTLSSDSDFRKSSMALIMATLASPCSLLRCAAAECLGRLAQVVAEPTFLAEVAQQIFGRLRSVRNPLSRAGHCLAVGCLHRCVGGLASAQHLNTSVGVLLAIAQDSSMPEVQVWALHALALVVDSGGPMFREFVEPSLNLVLQLLLRCTTAVSEVHHILGRLLSTLITTLGPELQGTTSSIDVIKHSCLLCCLIMRDSSEALLQAEAVSCVQRMHMFIPQQVQLPELIQDLQSYISNPNLALRRAAVAYLRQLCQKGADDVRALYAFMPSCTEDRSVTNDPTKMSIFSSIRTSLEFRLFNRLDVETDTQTIRDIEETILSMLQCSAHSRLNHWLSVLKEVLQASTLHRCVTSKSYNQPDAQELVSTNQANAFSVHARDKTQNILFHTDEDDHDTGTVVSGAEDTAAVVSLDSTSRSQFNIPTDSTMTARWPTRVFAVGCIRILISVCARLAHAAHNSPTQSTGSASNALAHFDLALARRLLTAGIVEANGQASNWLVLHLADLIRIAFISATSDSDRLRVVGLWLMHEVISRFSSVTDPDYHSHTILEQYQAQVSAALRPVFLLASSPSSLNDSPHLSWEAGTPRKPVHPSPELIALACLVCSCWVVSGVTHEVQHVQRVSDLLLQVVDQLNLDSLFALTVPTTAVKPSHASAPVSEAYSDDAMTMKTISVLRAWADVYVYTVLHAHPPAGRSGLHKHMTLSSTHSDKDIEGDEDEDVSDEFDSEDDLVENELLSVPDNIDIVQAGVSEHYSKDREPRPPMSSTIYQFLWDSVQPLIPVLSKAWLAVLKDHALLNLPDELSSQRPSSGGTFFGSYASVDRVRVYYAQHWPAVIRAASLWTYYEFSCIPKPSNGVGLISSREHFDLILGTCVEALNDANSQRSIPRINTCLRSLCCLLIRSVPRALLMRNTPGIALELLHVIYRLLIAMDSIETHLICMIVLKYVLIAAEERMIKQREAWLSDDSSNPKSRILLTSDSLNEIHNTGMTSSALLQTTSLLDAQMYELGEGGSLVAYPDRPTSQDCQVGSNPQVGLQPQNSIVFACLELVVCVVARYQPQLLNNLRVPEVANVQNGKLPPNRAHSIPATRFSNAPDAPCVLAAAIHCLRRVPDLCAPRVLLSTLNLATSIRDPSNSPVDLDCHDNLLRVLLNLCVGICRAVLFQASDYDSTSSQSKLKANRLNSVDRTDLPDMHGWMAANALNLCDHPDDADTEISSSANYLSSKSHSPRKHSRRKHRHQDHIDYLISWTWQQSRLADALVRLVVKLCNHHYPTLVTSVISDVTQSDGPVRNGDHGNGTQPDSSSHLDQSPKCTSSDGTMLASGAGGVFTHPEPLLAPTSSAFKWYKLISCTLLNILRHEHVKSDHITIPACCLAAITLVSRIAAQCSPPVFKSKELRNSILSHLNNIWTHAASSTRESGLRSATISDDSHVPDDRFAMALCGLRERRLCLAAIRLLVTHRDPAIHIFFTRTLTPQIFRWLHDLSPTESIGPPVDKSEATVIKEDLAGCLHAAIDVLDSLVSSTEPTHRHGLLIILLPLLCNLLCPTPPSNSVTSRWIAADSVALRSPEIRCGLHLCVLQHLIGIAPRFPTEFRSVFNAIGEHKLRLEKAIKHFTNPSTKISRPSHGLPKMSADRPSIQLKTNFSDFNKTS